MSDNYSLHRSGYLLFCVLLVILLTALGSFHWPYADDLTNITQLGEFPSRWDWFVDKYMHWTGRILTTAFIALSFYSIESHTLLSMILGTSFAGCGLLIWSVIRSLTGLTPLNQKDSTYLIPTVIACVCFFWSTKGYAGECFYWPTGGVVYGLALFFNFAWMAIFFTLMKRKTLSGRGRLTLMVVVSVLMGTSHEQLSAAVFIITFIMAAGQWKCGTKNERNVLLRQTGPLLIAYFVGMILLFVAPGNIARFTMGTNSSTFDFYRFWTNFLAINQTIIFHKTATHLLLGMLAALLIIFLTGPWKQESRHLSWSWIVSALITGYLSTIPIIYILSYVDRRLYFFPGIFLFLLGMGAGLPLAGWVAERYISANRLDKLHRIRPLILGGLMMATIVFISIEFTRAVNYRRVLEAVHQDILKYQGTDTDVVVFQAEPKSPRLFGRCDFGGDPTGWINIGTAKYYKVRSLREIPPVIH